jgi:hypothetical protein
MGSTKGPLPKIVLKENTFNDNKASNNLSIEGKKAMIHFYACEGAGETEEGSKGCNPSYDIQLEDVNQTDGNAAMMMGEGALNLEFVIKSGNPDAIGIRFAGAQGNVLSNIKVTAEGDSFAGIYSLIGTSSVAQDIEVVGGRIGIHGGMPSWPSFNNVRLINQTDYAIASLSQRGPLSLNGFYIEKQSTPIISDAPTNYSYLGSTNSGGAYALSDGVIKVRTASAAPAIDNSTRQLTLQNVYLEKVQTITTSSSNSPVAGNASGWAHVSLYSKVMKDYGANIGVRYEDGVMKKDDFYDINRSSSAPNVNSLLARHGVDRSILPSPDVIMERSKAGDPAYVYLKDKGISPVTNISASSPDQREALSNAINASGVKYVLVPMGTYLVKDTLDIKGNVSIIGMTGAKSEIRNHPGMIVTTGNPKYVLRTENSPTASPTIAFLHIGTNVAPNKPMGALHVRSGKTLVYRIGSKPDQYPAGSVNTFAPRNTYFISDNGGGRFYGIGTGGGGFARQWYTGFRGFKVLGTVKPITFYGVNPEDGGYVCPPEAKKPSDCKPNSASMQIEIRDARNVALRGFKCEDYNSVNIFNSSNIFASGIGGCVDWLFENVNQALVLNVASKFNGNTDRVNNALFEEKFGNSRVDLRAKHALASLQRGPYPDFSVWDNPDSIIVPPSTVCGDGVKEGSEACDLGSGNGDCPATCSTSCTLNTCGGGNPPSSVCGNGLKEQGEGCDAGESNGTCPATCSSACTKNTCDDMTSSVWGITGNKGGETKILSQAEDQLAIKIVKFPKATPVYAFKKASSFNLTRGSSYFVTARISANSSSPIRLTMLVTKAALFPTAVPDWQGRTVSLSSDKNFYMFWFEAPEITADSKVVFKLEGTVPAEIMLEDINITKFF